MVGVAGDYHEPMRAIDEKVSRDMSSPKAAAQDYHEPMRAIDEKVSRDMLSPKAAAQGGRKATAAATSDSDFFGEHITYDTLILFLASNSVYIYALFSCDF